MQEMKQLLQQLIDLKNELDVNPTTSGNKHFLSLLSDLTIMISTEKIALAKLEGMQDVNEITYSQELKANWSEEKWITDAYINRCIKEKYIEDINFNKDKKVFNDAYGEIIKSFNKFSDAVKSDCITSMVREKMDNRSMSAKDESDLWLIRSEMNEEIAF